jgi:hypothetical protein
MQLVSVKLVWLNHVIRIFIGWSCLFDLCLICGNCCLCMILRLDPLSFLSWRRQWAGSTVAALTDIVVRHMTCCWGLDWYAYVSSWTVPVSCGELLCETLSQWGVELPFFLVVPSWNSSYSTAPFPCVPDANYAFGQSHTAGHLSLLEFLFTLPNRWAWYWCQEHVSWDASKWGWEQRIFFW